MTQQYDRTSTDTTVVSDGHLVAGDHDDDRLPRRGRTSDDHGSAMPSDGEAVARDRFGGVNWGASFFGWLVAVAFAGLLAGIAGAVAAVLGTTAEIRSDAAAGAGTAGLVAAGVLLVLLLLGYYSGGYVAGRMSRFDGAWQGLGVWLVSVLVMAGTVGLGLVLGRQSYVSVDLPSVPVSTGALGWQILAGAGLLALAATLLAAVMGGSVGRRYHDRVDRVVLD